jgi:hypothetical protein
LPPLRCAWHPIFLSSVEYYSVNRMNRRYRMCNDETVADLPLKKTTSVTGNGLATRFGGTEKS